MKHYTAYTRYERVLLEQPDGTVKEILRALDIVDIPGEVDPDQAEHRSVARESNFIFLDLSLTHIATVTLAKKQTLPSLKLLKKDKLPLKFFLIGYSCVKLG